MLQTFAGLSGFILNMGAFTANKDDLDNVGIYAESLKSLNDMFLVLAIFQVIICVMDLAIICLDKVYIHLYLMWIEDVIMEIPLLIIAIYL